MKAKRPQQSSSRKPARKPLQIDTRSAPGNMHHETTRATHGPAALNLKDISLSDEVLFEQFLDGSRAAFESLVNRYKNRLGNFIYRYTSDRDEAEDLAQETFVRVYQKSLSFNRGTKFRPWLYTIARNVAIDAIRRRKRERKFRETRIRAAQYATYRSGGSSNTYGDPVAAANQKELEKIIQENLMTLSDKYRTVLILCDIQGHSYEEAAEIMKTPIKTVSTRLHRARKKFAQKIKPYIKP